MAAECYNFSIYDYEYCYGYVSTKSNRGKDNQLHIEKIDKAFNNCDKASGVLVIWVAKEPVPRGKSHIVGWYKDATVSRYYYKDGEGWPKNICAKAKDCILLPSNKRHKLVPRAGRDGYTYGMGQSNVWFGKKDDEKANLYIKNIVDYIESYDGENLALINR